MLSPSFHYFYHMEINKFHQKEGKEIWPKLITKWCRKPTGNRCFLIPTLCNPFQRCFLWNKNTNKDRIFKKPKKHSVLFYNTWNQCWYHPKRAQNYVVIHFSIPSSEEFWLISANRHFSKSAPNCRYFTYHIIILKAPLALEESCNRKCKIFNWSMGYSFAPWCKPSSNWNVYATEIIQQKK